MYSQSAAKTPTALGFRLREGLLLERFILLSNVASIFRWACDNYASKRVLEKNGFQLVQSGDDVEQGERLYRLNLR